MELKTFSEENGYCITCNNTYNNGYITMMTIAIAVKDSIEPSNKQTYPKILRLIESVQFGFMG